MVATLAAVPNVKSCMGALCLMLGRAQVPCSLLPCCCVAQVELVDRQLMSSLMGEWGMLQQLQGLANAFLISSPSMVEWVDALFTAVETHWKTRPVSSSLHSRHGGDCSTPTSTGKTTPRVGGAGGYESPGVYVGSPGAGGLPGTGGQTPVTVEDLDFSSLEALLQVRGCVGKI